MALFDQQTSCIKSLMLSISALSVLGWVSHSTAAVNEIHWQYGDITHAYQGGSAAAVANNSQIITFQHASRWEHGTHFMFLDAKFFSATANEQQQGLGDDQQVYSEWYSYFSGESLLETDWQWGVVKDIGPLLGFNWANEVSSHYYLPGMRMQLDLPGFQYANLDIMAYIQGRDSTTSTRSRVKEKSSLAVDFNWSYPFTVGNSQWYLQGHIEYIAPADKKITTPSGAVIDTTRHGWLLAQPQLRMDVGDWLGGTPKRWFAGIEYQYWRNKLGDSDTDESVVQALIVFRF